MTDKERQAIERFADAHAQTTERGVISGMIRSMVETSSHIDKATSWVLAGVGAALVLITSNFDRLKLLIGSNDLRVIFILLSLAIFFGILEKYFAMRAQIATHKVSLYEKYVSPTMTSFRQGQEQIVQQARSAGFEMQPTAENIPNIDRILTDYAGVFPRIFRNKIIEDGRKGLGDPYHYYRKIVTWYIGQITTCFLVLALVSSVLIFICYLSGNV